MLVTAAAEYSPFFGIEKGAVLQEARIFNESHINARQCQQVISRLNDTQSWLPSNNDKADRIGMCAYVLDTNLAAGHYQAAVSPMSG